LHCGTKKYLQPRHCIVTPVSFLTLHLAIFILSINTHTQDGDTGYGNAVNVQRTVFGYGRAGMAGIMLEDQVAPKQCGHVLNKSVVPLRQAVARIRAACDARDEYAAMYGTSGPLILARTDARQCDGLQAAIERCLAFVEAGADMTFLEAPQTVAEMEEYCRRVPGPKLANMLEQGRTPILSPMELNAMGYTMAAYPLTLLSASIRAMQTSLQRIYDGTPTDDIIATFAETKDVVGFTQYAREEERYRVDEG
jgi:2-methylisocitrate lyase-like PEP mutase family enzyme